MQWRKSFFYFILSYYWHISKPIVPKTICNVSKVIPRGSLIQSLVGGALFQASFLRNKRSQLHIIKVYLVHLRRQLASSAIPCNLQHRVFTAKESSKGVDIIRFCITTHKAHTSDIITITPDHIVKFHCRKWCTNILPQVLAMTSRTSARTIWKINWKGHLIRNLLKDHTRIYIFQHNRIPNS